MDAASGHPHVRGDYWAGIHALRDEGGPSPRAWGLLAARKEERNAKRAIPTCVGTTGGPGPGMPGMPGHPHVRGDY
ncbi:conserved hypothetical protein [Thermus scotoductus SA-01]|uniref:Uncharacterized protein n=1 Tax=Thermus scotoductus (strain ATCC 700910 / SA-01) TaxID=743525 RepID=E8PMA4_THESS|nr:conserved hypothetical protein [Thermus scotoductus SA-01]